MASSHIQRLSAEDSPCTAGSETRFCIFVLCQSCSKVSRGLSRSEPCTQQQTPQSALGLFPHKGAHASQSPAGTDKGSGEAAPPRCFFAASSPRRRPRGWGGNAPPRFSDRAYAREHLRACGAAQQHHQALKRFRRIGNRSAGGTADFCSVQTTESQSVVAAIPHISDNLGRGSRRSAGSESPTVLSGACCADSWYVCLVRGTRASARAAARLYACCGSGGQCC